MKEQGLQFSILSQKKLNKSVVYKQDLWKKVIDFVKTIKNTEQCFIQNISPGLGKSTHFIGQLYKQYPDHKIICSQVTIVNAINLPTYMANIDDSLILGSNIGYETSEKKISPNKHNCILYQTLKTTTLKYLIPLQRGLLENPSSYIIVIDEAHSNDINMQEQLAIIQNLFENKNKSELPFFVFQSGSIDPNKFMDYFSATNYIQVHGENFPIKELYLDDFKISANKDKNVNNFIVQICDEIVNAVMNKQNNIIQQNLKSLNITQPNSILIFVPKQKQILQLQKLLQKSTVFKSQDIEVIGLSSQQIKKSPVLVNRIDNPSFKIIIATNVIETGFTIKYLSFVIDTLKFYQIYSHPITKIQHQRLLPIDKQMQVQRRGRIGRVQPGIYIPIALKKDFDKLQPERELQIQIVNLISIINQFGLKQFLNLKFMGEISKEQIVSYLQEKTLFNSIQEKSHGFDYFLTRRLLQSSLFSNSRRALCVLLAIQLNYPIFELLVVFAFLDGQVEFQFKRDKYINDFREIIERCQDIQELQFLQIIQQQIQFFKRFNIDIYKGMSITDQSNQGLKIIQTILSIAFFEFKFKKHSNEYISKQGICLPLDHSNKNAIKHNKQKQNGSGNKQEKQEKQNKQDIQVQQVLSQQNIQYFVCMQVIQEKKIKPKIIMCIDEQMYKFPDCQDLKECKTLK